MTATAVHALDPLRDPRWDDLVRAHPEASVFHTPGWLAALHQAYGYRPLAYSTSPPGAALGDGIVFCEVESWLTGRRLVSVPFADHCAPLAGSPALLEAVLHALRGRAPAERWRSIEVRAPGVAGAPVGGLGVGPEYHHHSLDLRPPLGTLFRGLHRDSIQRRIQRAERAGLDYAVGRGDRLLEALYALLVLTRRRHGRPPQPRRWLRALVTALGDAVVVRVLFRHGQPVAGVLTLRFRDTVVYKYGASDARHHHLGGIPLLMWRAIEDAKATGARTLDLGRSDLDASGLVRFKERWGAERSRVRHLRWPPPMPERAWREIGRRLAGRALMHLPDALLRATGERLYRHMG
jgi:hypothetical protein